EERHADATKTTYLFHGDGARRDAGAAQSSTSRPVAGRIRARPRDYCAPFVRVRTGQRSLSTGPPAESGAGARVLGRSDDVSPDAVGPRRRRGRTAGAGPARSHDSRG